MRTLLFSTLVLIMAAFAAMADQADDVLTKLADIATHPEIATKAHQILLHDEKRFTPSCTEIKSIAPATISVFITPAFNRDGAPMNGDWLVRYTASVCGKDTLRTIHFRADDSGIEMSSLLPGNTQADPRLQVDVTKAFTMAVNKAYPNCRNPYVADTRMLSMPKNGDAPWEELWVANVCGNVFGQAIRFVPQESGTAFSLTIATGKENE